MVIAVATPVAAGDTPLTVIEPGTTFDITGETKVTQTRWNCVLFVAKPRISSGDTNKLGQTIRRAVSTLNLTILASVRRDENGTHRLVDVGVGYSVPIAGKQTVISSQTASQLGASLGLIARHVLNENEKQLAKVCVVTRSSTLLIFDTPAIMHRGDQHRDYTIRHFCWIDPASGVAATLVWMLGRDPDGVLRVINEPMRVVPAGTVEDRGIHVDGGEFMLGIPSQRAFALESLPPGLSVPWPVDGDAVDLATLACQSSYDEKTLTRLATKLNQAIASANGQREKRPE
tara:strand:+ start:71330 stop:72193 length:864 start_codon:yes stop_codon:yes gene_type:complete